MISDITLTSTTDSSDD